MGGVVKAVTNVVKGVASGISGGGGDVFSSVGSCAKKTVKAVGTAVSNVIKNPLPVIETLALTYALGPEGLAIGESATVAAVSSAAVSAANGGNIGDIATAAATSAAGSYAGQAAGTAVGADTTPGQLTTLGKITSSAVGGSTTTTLRLLADGSSFSDAVSAGAKVGVAAGITTGSIEGLKAAFNPSDAGTAPVVERSTGPGVDPTDATDTASSQNFPISPEVTVGKDPLSDPTIGPTESRLLASALYPAVYSTLFGKQQQVPISATPTTTAKAPTQQPVSPVQTTSSVGSQALGQALRIGDAGAPIFGGDKEEGKKAGWNVESLRYMGNSEA